MSISDVQLPRRYEFKKSRIASITKSAKPNRCCGGGRMIAEGPGVSVGASGCSPLPTIFA